MKERLIWILEQLQRLQDDERVRSEGASVFMTAKAELLDVIACYVEPAAAQAPFMASPEMMAAGLDAISSINARLNAISDGIATLLTDASKVAPMAPEVEQAAAPAPAAE